MSRSRKKAERLEVDVRMKVPLLMDQRSKQLSRFYRLTQTEVYRRAINYGLSELEVVAARAIRGDE